MSTFVLFVVMIVLLGLSLQWPVVGAAVYMWITVLHPQTGNAGLFAFQWSLISITTFALAYLGHGAKGFSLKSSVFVYILAFYAWTTITMFVALAPAVAYELWYEFTRTIIATVLIGGAISTRRDLNSIVWAVLAGTGAAVAGGFMQLVLTGGASTVAGIPETEFNGNNEIARLFGVSCLPFALFFSYHANGRWIRNICFFAFVACAIAILGTYSRGAFVALGAVFVYWALISRRRMMFLAQGAVLGVVLAILFSSGAAEKLIARMASIDNYEEDGSFQGRVFAWNFAIDVVNQSPITGGGFGVFRLDRYPGRSTGGADNITSWKDAHSVYFEALGEQGYVGLALYLLMFLMAFAKTITIARRCRGSPEHYWERDLAIAIRFSLLFHLVGGLTISTTYSQNVYISLMLVACLDKVSRSARVEAPSRISRAQPAGLWQPVTAGVSGSGAAYNQFNTLERK